MKPTILSRNDPNRAGVLGLVRRQLSAGSFTKDDDTKARAQLGADVVDGLVKEYGQKKATSKKAD